MFQFTRPQGARLSLTTSSLCFHVVSIHAPARGATPCAHTFRPDGHCFNSRARKGRDGVSTGAADFFASFNSRARKGRDPARVAATSHVTRFNSRARKGRDNALHGLVARIKVSIHAPARGATPICAGKHTGIDVSIHAPARGATAARPPYARRAPLFQFTRPQGARQLALMVISKILPFQFTRPQGARQVLQYLRSLSFGFQFTRPQGARRFAKLNQDRGAAFQFTRPQGARRPRRRTARRARRFNSRARKGRDQDQGALSRLLVVSIHAPARGATGPCYDTWYFHVVSIHAPARGATANCRHRGTQDAVSIHAPARGATKSSGYVARYAKFQFTRPQGARRVTHNTVWCQSAVSIHAPARGATGRTHRRGGAHGRFNSRARKGRDVGSLEGAANLAAFQFTRPQGARPGRARLVRDERAVSIHAPARGATWRTAWTAWRATCFNSRARKGRDFVPAGGGRFALVSIHAPARGATADKADDNAVLRVSIHAPARGATA